MIWIKLQEVVTVKEIKTITINHEKDFKLFRINLISNALLQQPFCTMGKIGQ